MNQLQTLSRSEMKNIMAGSSDPIEVEPVTCEEFHDNTGCYPSWSDETCRGTDGKLYSFASSGGSCG